jgi:hypothetical protein
MSNSFSSISAYLFSISFTWPIACSSFTYVPPTSSGIHGFTDANGGYRFAEGDTITFNVGGVVIGSVSSESILESTSDALISAVITILLPPSLSIDCKNVAIFSRYSSFRSVLSTFAISCKNV